MKRTVTFMSIWLALLSTPLLSGCSVSWPLSQREGDEHLGGVNTPYTVLEPSLTRLVPPNTFIRFKQTQPLPWQRHYQFLGQPLRYGALLPHPAVSRVGLMVMLGRLQLEGG